MIPVPFKLHLFVFCAIVGWCSAWKLGRNSRIRCNSSRFCCNLNLRVLRASPTSKSDFCACSLLVQKRERLSCHPYPCFPCTRQSNLASPNCIGGITMQPNQTQLERLEKLERFVRVTKLLPLAIVIVAGGLFVFGRFSAASPQDSKVLHVRGIVVEDESGHPRLVMGAPISNQGRIRQDFLTGLVLLSKDGTDRLSIGDAPNAQINGKISERISPGIGILLNDAKGNERGGFGFLDNGRVVLGLDRAEGTEGATLTVNDEDGFAGLSVKNPASWIVISMGNSREEGTRLLFRDREGNN